jgi:hypothetical protein
MEKDYKSEWIHTKVSPELKEKLVAEARRQQRPLSQIILFLVRDALGLPNPSPVRTETDRVASEV